MVFCLFFWPAKAKSGAQKAAERGAQQGAKAEMERFTMTFEEFESNVQKRLEEFESNAQKRHEESQKRHEESESNAQKRHEESEANAQKRHEELCLAMQQLNNVPPMITVGRCCRLLEACDFAINSSFFRPTPAR
jgi:hypothetical protein